MQKGGYLGIVDIVVLRQDRLGVLQLRGEAHYFYGVARTYSRNGGGVRSGPKRTGACARLLCQICPGLIVSKKGDVFQRGAKNYFDLYFLDGAIGSAPGC